jgi:hypothetical protein
MGFTVRSHESVKQGEKRYYRRIAASKNMPSRPAQPFINLFLQELR